MSEHINEMSNAAGIVGGGWHNPPSLLELVAERDRYKKALEIIMGCEGDVIYKIAQEALAFQPQELTEDSWSNEGGYSGCGWESDAC